MRWLRTTVLTSLLGAITAVAAAATSPPLEADLQVLLQEQGLSGAVYALVDGEHTRLGAIGLAHAPSGQPMTQQTRVHVGSIAKTMIALAVLRLVTEGRLMLDAPVHTLLPQWPLDNPWHAEHPVLLRHLLNHTAGLEDLRPWHLLNARHTPDMPLADGLAQHPDLLRVRHPPGTRMSYSNIGYLLAGMVLETVTGERYETWVERELLRPLGLHDSTLAYTTQIGIDADPRLAWGHLDATRPHSAMPIGARPGAQFTTTAADMARLARLLMGDGRSPTPAEGAPAFIAPALLHAMGRATETEAAAAGLPGGYALGLATRDRHGAIGRCHGGSIIGFRAMLCLFDGGRAFFVAFNTDSETADHERVYRRLMQAIALPSALAEAAPTGDTSPPGGLGEGAAWNGRYAPAPSRHERFALLDWWFEPRLWRAIEPGVARWGGGPPARLQALGPRMYRQEGRIQASQVLLVGEKGERLISDGQRTWRRVSSLVWWAGQASLALGACGALWWLTAPVWRRWRHRESLMQPAWWVLLALIAATAAVAALGWQRLGEATPAAWALWAASAALLPATLWQVLRAASRWRAPGRSHDLILILDLIAALALLQLAALLAAGGLLPMALWR